MSTAYETYLIHGFEVQVERDYAIVTKYNEDTGEPYDKKVMTDYCTVSCNGKKILNLHIDEVGDKPYRGDLQLVKANNQYFYGQLIGRVSDMDHQREFDLSISESVGELGYTIGVKPKTFMVMGVW